MEWVLLTIVGRALVGEAVLSCAPWMCLVRVAMCALSGATVATTSVAALATMISRIVLDVILWNTVLIHGHAILERFLLIVL